MITGVIMSSTLNSVPGDKRIRAYVTAAVALALIAIMALDTKVISLTELESAVGFHHSNLLRKHFQRLKRMLRITL